MHYVILSLSLPFPAIASVHSLRLSSSATSTTNALIHVLHLKLTGVRSPNTHHPPNPPATKLSRSRSLPPFTRFCTINTSL